MNDRFPDEVCDKLVKAGWFPGRDVDFIIKGITREYSLFEKAELVLREFGGLKIGVNGRGRECATSKIEFDPELGTGLAEATGLTNDDGKKIYLLGEVDDGHAYLIIDEDGAVYFYFGEYVCIDTNMDGALVRMMLGLKPISNTP
jgi:hypothetical protein